MEKSNIFFLIILSLVIIACYANTLGNPFLWDDEVIIVGNPFIRSWTNLKHIFTTDIFGTDATKGKFYRPLHAASYIIDYKIWKLNPVGYHIHGIALHMINAGLVFYLLLWLGLKKNTSFLTALVFAVHPANSEAICNMSGRGDLLSLLFMIVALLLFMRALKGKAILFLYSVICFVLALLSKESAIVLPFIIVSYTYLFKKQAFKKRNVKQFFISIFTLTSVYILIRLFYLNSSGVATLSIIKDASLYERLLTVPRILYTYIGLLLLPHDLHMEYLFLEKSTSPYIHLGVPLLLLSIWLILRHIKPSKYTLFFMLWFFIGLGPFYNVVLPLASTVREHWVYAPGIGFLALAVYSSTVLFEKNKKRYVKITSIVIASVFLVYCISYTIIRNRDWSDALRLYEHDLRLEQDSFVLHNNTGVEYFRRGRMEEAKKAFLKSIEVSPGGAYSMAHNNVGVIYENEGDIERAVYEYKRSILQDGYSLAYENLGRLYMQLHRYYDAQAVLEEGSRLHPFNKNISLYLNGVRERISKRGNFNLF